MMNENLTQEKKRKPHPESLLLARIEINFIENSQKDKNIYLIYIL